jgi:hypothetical protein
MALPQARPARPDGQGDRDLLAVAKGAGVHGDSLTENGKWRSGKWDDSAFLLSIIYYLFSDLDIPLGTRH